MPLGHLRPKCHRLQGQACCAAGLMHVSAGLYGTSLVKQLVVMALPHFGIASTNYTTEEYLKLTYQLFFQVEVYSIPTN